MYEGEVTKVCARMNDTVADGAVERFDNSVE
jgi:hypothetical protein